MAKKNPTKNKAILTGNIGDPSAIVTECGIFNLIPLNAKVQKSIMDFVGCGPVTLLGSFLRKRVEIDDKVVYLTEIQVSQVGLANTGVQSMEICGFLGRDPHIAYPPDSGEPVVTLSVATNDYRPNPEFLGRWIEETTWHKAVSIGEEAVALAEKLTKGSFVRVEGRLKQRRGKQGTVAEVLVNGLNGHKLVPPLAHEEKFQRMLQAVQEKQSSPLFSIEEPEIIIIDLA